MPNKMTAKEAASPVATAEPTPKPAPEKKKRKKAEPVATPPPKKEVEEEEEEEEIPEISTPSTSKTNTRKRKSRTKEYEAFLDHDAPKLKAMLEEYEKMKSEAPPLPAEGIPPFTGLPHEGPQPNSSTPRNDPNIVDSVRIFRAAANIAWITACGGYYAYKFLTKSGKKEEKVDGNIYSRFKLKPKGLVPPKGRPGSWILFFPPVMVNSLCISYLTISKGV